MNLVISGLVFLTSIWLTNRLSSPTSRLRLLDHPNERSLHDTPIPRTGGLAILASLGAGLVLAGSLAFIAGKLQVIETGRIPWFGGMILLIAVVSLWDDWAELPPVVRLGVHGLAAAGMAIGAGLRIDEIGFPVLGARSLGWLAVPVTILFLIWMTNLYNFMDGMDGFASGMAVIGFSFLSFLAWQGGYAFMGLLSLLTVGAAAGFLFYNRPPARIFMGDVGSTLLGFLAGALSVLGIAQKLFDFWVPVLIFSPFIFDATATLLRRALKGEKVWQAHREHYYQRLVLVGWSHRKTVLLEYFLMIACGSSAVGYTKLNEADRLTLLIAWVFIYSGLALGVRLTEQRSKSRKQSLQAQQRDAVNF
jgi:UDP-N-acetylmuramyl pentapeptide phosphotransferase/UDP-N-acetylglucosamine-1-phosphate transferase